VHSISSQTHCNSSVHHSTQHVSCIHVCTYRATIISYLTGSVPANNSNAIHVFDKTIGNLRTGRTAGGIRTSVLARWRQRARQLMSGSLCGNGVQQHCQFLQLALFHRRTRASYVYNVCLAWYNVVLTPRIHSSVKIRRPTAGDSCDGGISVLYNCLSWYKFVNTHLYHSRQLYNIHYYLLTSGSRSVRRHGRLSFG